MMRGRKKKPLLDKEEIVASLERAVEILRLKRALVEPAYGADGESDTIRREAVLWIDRSAQTLRSAMERLQISLPNTRKEKETGRELLRLLEELTVVAEDLALIWSSAKERLYPLAVRIFDTIKAYCAV